MELDPRFGQWFVFAYDDVRALLDDPRLTPDRMHAFANDAPAAAVAAVREHAPWLIHPTDAGYEWIGAIVGSALHTGARDGHREAVATAADEILAGVLTRERFEAVADYAYALSGRMLADLLGLDRREGDRLVGWGLDIVTFFTSVEATSAGAERMARAVGDMVARVRDLIHDAADGFLPHAARAAAERGRALDDEGIAHIVLPFVTGHVDAAHLVAVSIWLMLGHDDQRARLRAEPGLLGGAVSESLRYGAPVALVPRAALEPFALHGHAIERGERLQLSLAAANRDPLRFPDPDRFDIARSQRGALGFGHGAGSCPGASMVRAHAAAALDVLLRRAPDLALDPEGATSWRAIPGLNALQRLDVRTAG